MERLRGLPENPAQGRRAAVIIPPVPPLRDMSSSSNLSVSGPLSSAQVVALAREAMQAALNENETKAAEASSVSNDLKPGVTIDLSRKNIQKLPDEVVDIIKNELERLALSHNYLQSFPVRFSECTSLRYLNVRQNKIKDFPLPLCDLKSLEILDLGRNKLRVLPPDIVKLSSLKVLAIQKNMISELPLCLADMPSLQVLKLDGNPLVFPPPEVLQVQAASPPNEGILKDSEVTEVTVTAHIKKFLKQKASSINGRFEIDTTGDESSEGTETPRLPTKRGAGGRFPIRVNGADISELRSPSISGSKAPPIPTRSHYRGLSQQNTATPMRRPGVMPLTIGNVNERVRSNSETFVQASRERSESRSRRMGMVSKKPSDLGTLDEIETNNRFSIHYRGLSHGSAMQGNGANRAATESPASPAEPALQRPIYVRRLSILPERRHESKVFDPVLEAAKGVLYSIFQIHPTIQTLLGLVSDGSARRSSLEIVFYNTNAHVEELEHEIQKHDAMEEEGGDEQLENENVQRACLTLVRAYIHVCSLLMGNVDLIIGNGDPRFIRTLLTQLYNTIMELRVTCAPIHRRAGTQRQPSVRSAFGDNGGGDTIRARSRENSVTPTVADRPMYARGRSNNSNNFIYNPSNLRVATDVPMITSASFINGTGRTATITSITPRSGESFASLGMGRALLTDFSEEDRVFEKIYLSLQKSSELVMRTLPYFLSQFSSSLRNAQAQRPSESHVVQCWRVLFAKCSESIQQTETLKDKLSSIKLKEPGIRTQASFWSLCNNFVDAWVVLITKIKTLQNDVQLPPDTKPRLRPIQHSMKETWELILSSPWSYFVKQPNVPPDSRVASPYSVGSATPVPMPMTPQSAALGPAVQATVPSTPQSASFAAAFNGNVFERADALISMGGLHMSRNNSISRTNTMASSSNTSLNSLTSSFSSQDGSVTGSMLSNNNISNINGVSINSSNSSGVGGIGPGPLGPLPLRLNNGSKVGF